MFVNVCLSGRPGTPLALDQATPWTDMIWAVLMTVFKGAASRAWPHRVWALAMLIVWVLPALCGCRCAVATKDTTLCGTLPFKLTHVPKSVAHGSQWSKAHRPIATNTQLTNWHSDQPADPNVVRLPYPYRQKSVPRPRGSPHASMHPSANNLFNVLHKLSDAQHIGPLQARYHHLYTKCTTLLHFSNHVTIPSVGHSGCTRNATNSSGPL